MIYLHTGQPGAGKTLYTIWEVYHRAKAEKRPVYYNGINDLQLPEWEEFEKVEEWYNCPTGAIIVIDEAQREFRPRGSGKRVPESVAAFETHRHNGHDVYLITQHPNLIDQNIRRLAGTHKHLVRAFGAKTSTVHEWNEVRTQVERRSDSSKTVFKYPKEVFNWYKSAEVHTHKMKLPKQVYYLAFFVLIIGYALYYVSTNMLERMSDDDETEQMVEEEPPTTTPQIPTRTARTDTDRPGRDWMSKEDWLASHQPRAPGLPHTSPRYDDVTTPTRAPVPAACIEMRGECRCYSQQGTRLDTSGNMCREIVAKGYFVDFEPDGSARRASAGDEGTRRPDAAAPRLSELQYR